MKKILTQVQFGALGGAIYLLGRFVIYQIGGDYSSVADWLFRVIIIMFVSLAIINHKRKNENLLGIGEGIKIGSLMTLFLAIFIAIGTWFYGDLINTEYNKGYQETHRAMHYNKTMRKYIFDKWNRDTITAGARDTVGRAVDKYMESTAFFYTTRGQSSVNFLYTFFWGLATAVTVSMLLRNAKEE